MPGASIKQRLDVTRTLKEFRETRGRPQFTVRRDPTACGLFSTFEHEPAALPPTTAAAAAAASRSASVSAAGAGAAPGREGRSRERSTSARPPFRAPSASTGLFDPHCPTLSAVPDYFRSRSGSRQQLSRTGSTAMGPAASRSVSASRSCSAAVGAPEADGGMAASTAATRSDAHVPLTALLARSISKKTRGDREAEREARAIRRSLDARYKLVTESEAAREANRVHRVPHDGLRVEYYDRGRKMTTTTLYSARRHTCGAGGNGDGHGATAGPSSLLVGETAREAEAHSPTRDSLRYGPGMTAALWSGIVGFCGGDERRKLSAVNRAISAIALSCATEDDAPEQFEKGPGGERWDAMRDAALRVRAIPGTFFDALQHLQHSGGPPPRRTLLTLSLTAALVDAGFPFLADERTVWAELQPLLDRREPEQLLSHRLVATPMGAVECGRVAAIGEAIAQHEAELRESGCGGSLVSAVAAQSRHAAAMLEYVQLFGELYHASMV